MFIKHILSTSYLYFQQLTPLNHSNISLEPDPFREVLADRTLQEVVDKIFPWMSKKEDEEEKAFYAARGIKLKPEYETEVEVPAAKKLKSVDEGKKSAKALSKVCNITRSVFQFLQIYSDSCCSLYVS